MIAAEMVDEIRRMLTAGGLSQRKIARRLGVSRGTVGAIAGGRRPDYAARESQAEDDFPVPAGPPRRCPGCGGMVQMPCLCCFVRAVVAKGDRFPVAGAG